ncbi:hypothetical protein ES708_02366 [subsurface metagenome]
MSDQLMKDVARNKRIVAFILAQYEVPTIYALPPIVFKFVTALQQDVARVEAWLGPIDVK